MHKIKDLTHCYTIIVSKEKAKTSEDAIALAKELGASELTFQETNSSFRFRQKNPNDFVENGYKTLNEAEGVTVVYGTLKTELLESELKLLNSSRHFKGTQQEISLSEDKQLPGEIQILKTGKYFDPRYKDFEITSEMLLSMIKNHKENVRGIDIAIDFGHATDEEAAAWVKDLFTKDNNSQLWAKVEWSGAGKKALTEKNYRYISADFTNNFIHNETKKEFGPTLYGAALTNRPVIKGMAPVIQLTEDPNNKNGGTEMEEKDKKIAELEALIKDMKAKMEAEGAAMGEMKKKLEEYQAKEAKLVEEQKLAEKKTQFDKMLSEGKVVEAQREAYVAGDMVKFCELAKPLKLSEDGHSGEGETNNEGGEGVTNAQKIIQLAEEKVKVNPKMSFAEAIVQVKKEKPELTK